MESEKRKYKKVRTDELSLPYEAVKAYFETGIATDVLGSYTGNPVTAARPAPASPETSRFYADYTADIPDRNNWDNSRDSNNDNLPEQDADDL